MKQEVCNAPRTQTPEGPRRELLLCIWVFGCLGLSLLAGCDRSLPDMIPVRGTVTFNGGPPPAEGVVVFAPITAAEGFNKRPGTGNFDTSGKYSATSFEGANGLVPGTYTVRVMCYRVAPTMEDPTGVSYVPVGFSKNLVVDDSLKGFDIDVPLAEAAP